ncbi:MAG: hypothetical protein IPJ94_19520 [Chloroflexi bacterium]|nr:hypothetical protein [Chloroflexota bacterium]
MTDLVIDYTLVREIEVIEQFTGPADETVDPGHYARLAPATGKLTKGNASSAGEVGAGEGICITCQVNTITILKKGILWLGDGVLDALNFGATVYLSNTDGTLGRHGRYCQQGGGDRRPPMATAPSKGAAGQSVTLQPEGEQDS